MSGFVGCRFGFLGAFIGKYASVSLLLSLLLIIPSLFGIYFNLQMDFGLNDGFVSLDAPSRLEIAAQKEFFGATGESWYLALFGLTKSPNGNMLEEKEFAELNDFYVYVTQTMNLTIEESGTPITFKYWDLCAPLCAINDQMQKLIENSWLSTFRYPVSRVLGYNLNIGKHVFHRTVHNQSGDLIGSKFLAFYFTIFVESPLIARQIALFETTLAKLVNDHNANPNHLVELVNHGSNSVTAELQKAVYEWLRHQGIGHLLFLFGFLILSFFSGWLHNQFPFRRVFLALVSLLLAYASILSAIGYLSLIGEKINLLIVTSPICTLVLIFNVYGAFQIADGWSRLLSESIRKQYTPSERLATTFEQVAPSYLTTHLSIIAGFFVAHFFLIQNYSIFALMVSLSVLFNFLYQIFGFSALLSLMFADNNLRHFYNSTEVAKKPSISLYLQPTKNNIINNNNNNNNSITSIIKKTSTSGGSLLPDTNNRSPADTHISMRSQKRRLRTQLRSEILAPYLRFLSTLTAKFLFVGILIGVGWFGVRPGIQQLRNQMDYRQLLPADSSSIRAFDLLDNIWEDILQIVYIVKKPPNFESVEEFNDFKRFIDVAINLPQAMPNHVHMSWIFDYYRDQLDKNFFDTPLKMNEGVNMSKFSNFINNFPYNAWKSGVHFHANPTGEPQIDSMLVLVAYNGTRGLSGKLKLIQNCRQVAVQFPQFEIASFDTDSQTVDIISSVPQTCLILVMSLIASTAIVNQLLLWNATSTTLVTLSAASIAAALFGIGKFVGLELDLLTVPATATILAQGIHLGVQFVGQFLSCWAKDERLRRAFEITASPMFKTAALWILMLVPQLFGTVPFFSLQLRLLIVGLLLVMFHALFFMPLSIDCLSRFYTKKN